MTTIPPAPTPVFNVATLINFHSQGRAEAIVAEITTRSTRRVAVAL